MSTLVSYLLAIILQFMNLSVPKEQETVIVLPHQQCEETVSTISYSFIINNNEQVLKTSKKEL